MQAVGLWQGYASDPLAVKSDHNSTVWLREVKLGPASVQHRPSPEQLPIAEASYWVLYYTAPHKPLLSNEDPRTSSWKCELYKP